MEYRRAKVEGGTFFFTQVTYNRRQFLCEQENIFLLRKVFRKVIQRHSFSVDAIAQRLRQESLFYQTIYIVFGLCHQGMMIFLGGGG